MLKPQELLEPRVTTYLKSTWYARWGVIGIVASSFWFVHGPKAVIGFFLALAIVYNFLLLAGNRRGLKFLANRALILIIDGALSLLLVMLTGSDSSPYLLVLVFMIISAAYWYGGLVAALVGAVQTIILLAQHIIANHTQLYFPKNLLIRMFILMVVGLYVSLITKSDRLERRQLTELGAETEKERQQLLALVNNMRDAVLVVDNGGDVIMSNKAATALTDAPDQLHGRSINQSMHFLDNDGQRAELKIGGATNAFERKDLQLQAPDKSLINVSINVAPYIVDRQNRGHVVIIHDITQDTTVDQERKEFIAVASHELRTPLTIAQGDISMLLQPPYLPENQESVDMLNGALRSLQQLSHIIKDLTNLSRVESEQLEVELEPLNPVALLDEFKVDYAEQAKAKGLDLRIEVAPDLTSSTILTSRYVVREILSIFIANAIKFTDKGSVTLAVMNPQDKTSGVTFRVSDTGIGVSQSDQKKVFEKFFQSEEYTTRVHGGTGLGLYIAKQLAARITARLWFDTELGRGSSFYLWVPPYSKHAKDSGKVAAAETKDFFDTV